MQAGNVNYDGPGDLPDLIPVFPLEGALLLPRGQMPLNVFEPRYVAMIDHAMAGNRIIGMIQPLPGGDDGEADLFAIGCAGRVTSYAETGDGRYMIALTGIARFKILEEMPSVDGYRQCRISSEAFRDDFIEEVGSDSVDRNQLLDVFRQYLDANRLEADWSSIDKASNETLVNALSMMSPYGPAEKQALLEAPSLRARAETLIALTEILLSRGLGGASTNLQ